MSRIADIGAAVIGTGFIGTVHVEALRRIGVQVRGVLGSTPGARRGAGRRRSASATPTPRSTTILADPTVDVVHVTSPNHLHVPQARGDPRRRQARRLREAAGDDRRRSRPSWSRWPRASGLVNAVNFNIRFYPLNQHVRELVADGGLGDVRFVTGHYFQDWLLHDTDWNWRLEPDKGGALRAVGDIGSHWLDLMAFVTGQPIVAVMADLATFITVRQRADAARSRRSRPSASADTVDRDRWRTEDDGDDPRSASTTAPAARWPSRRSAPAGRTRSSGRSTAPTARRRGTRRRPTTCGSATATGRTRSSSATRR